MYRQMNKRPSVGRSTVEATPERGVPSAVAPIDGRPSALRRAIQLANHGDCRGAMQLLRPQGHDPETMNAMGVCLMRMGQINEATVLYRGMVIKPSCTWVRPEVPTLYKLNFATALLLGGTPSGCLSVLNDVQDPGNRMVQRLRGAIKAWEAELSFWRRWDWRINRIEPPKCRIKIDFAPGEFSHGVGDGGTGA